MQLSLCFSFTTTERLKVMRIDKITRQCCHLLLVLESKTLVVAPLVQTSHVIV
jgi:hypothetical protein